MFNIGMKVHLVLFNKSKNSNRKEKINSIGSYTNFLDARFCKFLPLLTSQLYFRFSYQALAPLYYNVLLLLPFQAISSATTTRRDGNRKNNNKKHPPEVYILPHGVFTTSFVSAYIFLGCLKPDEARVNPIALCVTTGPS